jgi:hypothetical protein
MKKIFKYCINQVAFYLVLIFFALITAAPFSLHDWDVVQGAIFYI